MLKTQMAISVDERLVQAHVFTPDDPSGAGALFLHGYRSSSGSYLQYGKALANDGVTCVAFDLGGHGESEGKLFDLAIADNMNDVRGAYDVLAAQPGVQPDRIGVAGTSYGAYLGARLIGDRAIRSLLFRVPALYRDEMADTPRRYFSTDDEMELPPFSDNQVLATVAAFSGRITLVTSELDTVINSAVTAGYLAAIGEENHIVMESAAHVLGPAGRKAFKGILRKWAAESL
jgi:esterase/lipase